MDYECRSLVNEFISSIFSTTLQLSFIRLLHNHVLSQSPVVRYLGCLLAFPIIIITSLQNRTLRLRGEVPPVCEKLRYKPRGPGGGLGGWGWFPASRAWGALTREEACIEAPKYGTSLVVQLPVVRNPPSNVGDVGSIPGWGTKIPRATERLSLHATVKTQHSQG